jgi:hypothetical protein
VLARPFGKASSEIATPRMPSTSERARRLEVFDLARRERGSDSRWDRTSGQTCVKRGDLLRKRLPDRHLFVLAPKVRKMRSATGRRIRPLARSLAGRVPGLLVCVRFKPTSGGLRRWLLTAFMPQRSQWWRMGNSFGPESSTKWCP